MMPGLVMNGLSREGMANYAPKEGFSYSSGSASTPQSHESGSIDLVIDGVIDTSIEQLYHNVCEMQSSDQSPSRRSFISYGNESRIDSELYHLVGHFGEVEVMKEVVEPKNKEDGDEGKLVPEREIKPADKGTEIKDKIQSVSAKSVSPKSNPNERPPIDKSRERILRKPNVVSPIRKQKNFASGVKLHTGTEDLLDAGLDNPDLGPFLLKQTRDLISSGENPKKALELALRAMKSFEITVNGKANLELVMCLHVIAAIYCSLGQYNEAIPALERSIKIPVIEEGQDHALAKFVGCMQLGDTYAMIGQIENSILCYTAGLEIQRQVLGEMDSRVGETCRYLAEAYVQSLQFDEAEKLCQMALNVHKKNGTPASLEEAADRRLMALICDSKGDYEAALEHYVLAGMAMAANGQQLDVASIDCSIGDSYLSLARYDEAVFSYQKALTVFKSTKGENHPTVASVFVRLADLYNKIGKLRESKSYCENALRLYGRPNPGIPAEEIASGFIDISAIFQSMDELEQALRLLQKALKIYANAPGHVSTTAGIEAQIGVLYYMMGNYSASYNSFSSAISKLRASGEKKTAFLGIALNQMGLSCVQRYAIGEAAELFEEARSILEKEYGPCHPDTLGIYSNLAGTYDAMGRYNFFHYMFSASARVAY